MKRKRCIEHVPRPTLSPNPNVRVRIAQVSLYIQMHYIAGLGLWNLFRTRIPNDLNNKMDERLANHYLEIAVLVFVLPLHAFHTLSRWSDNSVLDSFCDARFHNEFLLIIFGDLPISKLAKSHVSLRFNALVSQASQLLCPESELFIFRKRNNKIIKRIRIPRICDFRA